MPNQSQLNLQLHDLDLVLEALERMNAKQETAVPGRVTQLLHELGLMDRDDPGPPGLIDRVLDKQQQVRRRLGSMGRQGI